MNKCFICFKCSLYSQLYAAPSNSLFHIVFLHLTSSMRRSGISAPWPCSCEWLECPSTWPAVCFRFAGQSLIYRLNRARGDRRAWHEGRTKLHSDLRGAGGGTASLIESRTADPVNCALDLGLSSQVGLRGVQWPTWMFFAYRYCLCSPVWGTKAAKITFFRIFSNKAPDYLPTHSVHLYLPVHEELLPVNISFYKFQ